MKANEIMVGDWVHYRVDLGKDGFYEKDIQINNIYGCDVNCKLEYEEIISGTPLYYCYPIHLTPEILEKNGIVYDYDEEECVADYKFVKLKGYQYSDDEILIDYCNGHIKVISDFYGDVNMEIEYVHELQHALKLLKIEKTIEL